MTATLPAGGDDTARAVYETAARYRADRGDRAAWRACYEAVGRHATARGYWLSIHDAAFAVMALGRGRGCDIDRWLAEAIGAPAGDETVDGRCQTAGQADVMDDQTNDGQPR